MAEWTHFDSSGRPVMVDVSEKKPTKRIAIAEGWIELPNAIYSAIKNNSVSKGDPMSIAELGGIMGAKRTSDLIPLCHAIKLDSVEVRCELCDDSQSIRVECRAIASDVTGVEMEALTGVSVASLVLYDMCKGIDKGIVIKNIRLLEKSGGKSGLWKASESIV